MISILEINASEWLEKAAPLMELHWEEVAKDTGVPRPNMDKGYLELAEEAGRMFTLGMFNDEELIGYSMNDIGATLNFDNLVIADNQGIFIKKEYRARLLGVRLIHETEKLAKKRGATRFKMHTYMDSRADKLLRRLQGYSAYDIIHTKEL